MSKCFRIEYENYLHGHKKPDRTHGGEPTPNHKEKLDGRVIRTTVVSRTVGEILSGIDKTHGSHAQTTVRIRNEIINKRYPPPYNERIVNIVYKY